jgi:hypothetical protein
MTRSVEELRRESERNRAQLATTVDRVREQITDTAEDIRHKVSPQHIKSEVSDFISTKTLSWVDSLKQHAKENPMQAIAAGAAIAVPVLRLARGFPLPLFAWLSAATIDDWGRACVELEGCAGASRGGGGSSGGQGQGYDGRRNAARAVASG